MIQPYLDKLYKNCLDTANKNNFNDAELSSQEKIYLNDIIDNAESFKGLLTVLITSLVYKKLNPNQDIRNHQASIKGGYSGRSFDTKNITPFLKEKSFPHMAESGWLTRSFEQKSPFNLQYKGEIKKKTLKDAFLNLINNVEVGTDPEKYLTYIFVGLILARDKQQIQLAKPVNLTISTIITLLKEHFQSKYKSDGASRLPTLAIYAVYQCLIDEIGRFNGKELLPIESHTSSDKRSGRIGDIDIIDEDKREFEAVEIKHNIPISLSLVKDAYEKFFTTPVKRYYLLSTVDINATESNKIEAEILRIKNTHGCQVIVNGIYKTLQYYLRLLNDPYLFTEKYVLLLEKDTSIKFEHKQKWNELVATLK